MKLTKLYSTQLTAIFLLLFLMLSKNTTGEASQVISAERIGMLNAQFYNLMDYFYEENLCAEDSDYPAFYAGSRMEENYEYFIVYVTDDSDEIRNIIFEGTGSTDVKIEKVKYSYQELESAKSQIEQRYQHLKQNPDDNWCGSYIPDIQSIKISAKENRVIISIANYHEADEAVLKAFFFQKGFPDFDGVRFVSADDEEQSVIIDDSDPDTETQSSYLIKLGDMTGLKYHDITVNVTDEEVAQILYNSIMFGRAELIQITERNTIEAGDVVICDYTTYIDDQLYSQKYNEEFFVGTGEYLLVLENELIGKKVGELYTIEVVLPDTYPNSKIAGKEMRFDITVKSINYYTEPQLSDLTVEDYRAVGYESYEEYFAALKEATLYDRQYYRTWNIANELIEQLRVVSQFMITQEDIQRLCIDMVMEHEKYAYLHNLTLDDYLKAVMSMTREQFDQYCVSESVRILQSDLITQGLMKRCAESLTDDEIESLAQKKYCYTSDQIASNFDSIKQNILQMEAYENIIAMSTPYSD